MIPPQLIFLTSEKVHLKVSISSDLARGKSPKFNLISHMSSMSHDSGKSSRLKEKPSAEIGGQELLATARLPACLLLG